MDPRTTTAGQDVEQPVGAAVAGGEDGGGEVAVAEQRAGRRGERESAALAVETLRRAFTATEMAR